MGLPWYKRDVDAWRGGTRGMSLELRGFYSELLDAMWDRQAPIPNNESKIAMMVNCNKRTVRKLLPQLIALGKIVETADGLTNARMAREIDGAQPGSSRPIQTELDRNSRSIQPEFDPKNQKNPMISTREVEEELRTEKKSPPCSPSREPEAPPSKQARPQDSGRARTSDVEAGFEAWARVAGDYGLPACKSVSETRRKRMAKRLKVAGGAEAFEAVLRREIASSRFLRGKKPPKPGSKPFKADVDFVLQDTSWDRIVDGFYADEPGTPPAPPRTPVSPSSPKPGAPGSLPEAYVHPMAEDAACAGMTLEEYQAVIARAKAAGKVRKNHPIHNAGQYRLDCSEQIADAGHSHGGRHEDAV